MRKTQWIVTLTTLLITLGAVISNEATLQAQEQTSIPTYVGSPAIPNMGGVIPVLNGTVKIVYETIEIIPDTPIVVVDQREVECLARNIYFEARGEPKLGQVAVAFVTRNRVNAKQWPNSVCGVVYDRNKRGCQFSWTCDGRNHVVRNPTSWAVALDIATQVLSNQIHQDPTLSAVFYHNQHVAPGWSRAPTIRRTVRVGNHTFYKLA